MILVLDQSSDCTGWALCTLKGLVESGFWKQKGKHPVIRIAQLKAHLREMFNKHPIETLVIEDHTNIRQLKGSTSMVMGYVWGSCVEQAMSLGAECVMQNFATVKKHFGIIAPKGKSVTPSEKIKPVQIWAQAYFKLPFYPQGDQSAALIHAAYYLETTDPHASALKRVAEMMNEKG